MEAGKVQQQGNRFNMTVILPTDRNYQAFSEACQLGRRRGRQTDAKSNACVYDCVTGTVKTQGGRLVSIEDNASCCPSCDDGGSCKSAGFPWWAIIAAAVVGYYVGSE